VNYRNDPITDPGDPYRGSDGGDLPDHFVPEHRRPPDKRIVPPKSVEARATDPAVAHSDQKLVGCHPGDLALLQCESTRFSETALIVA
jgi:hypothetical protein